MPASINPSSLKYRINNQSDYKVTSSSSSSSSGSRVVDLLTRYSSFLLHQLKGNASFGVGVVGGVDAVLDEHPSHFAEHLLLFAANVAAVT